MNFLAHIYLSGNNEEILVGNFIGDYVKGKQYKKFPPAIQEGILLHRHIDFYTDTHAKTHSSKKFISYEYGLYSGIVVDIFYDHFLAVNWKQYSSVSLSNFVRARYKTLSKHYDVFPEGVQRFFPYFIKSNWLEAYSNFNGLASVLRRMSYRTSLPDHSEYAIQELKYNYSSLSEYFREFFLDIIAYVKDEFDIKIIP